MLTGGSENLFYLAYGMPQSRTSRRADVNANTTAIEYKKIETGGFEDILLYPNPANSFVYVVGLGDNAVFELSDMFGKIILTKKLYADVVKHKIEFPNISNGIYNYKIKLDKDFYSGKLNVIQNEK